jgi:hypothetical protein
MGPCCDNNMCEGGLACVNDTCVGCGGNNQRCCANDMCKDGGCCVTVFQGGAQRECRAAGMMCPGAGGACTAGRCAACGSNGQPCCNGDRCYDAGQACIGNRCTACGGVGQAACPGSVCNAGLCVNQMDSCVAAGTTCGQGVGMCNANGTCGMGMNACGGLNMPCCGIGIGPTGAFCSQSGTTCTGQGGNRRCVACGGLGQPCCGDQETCKAGSCGGFGGNRTCR